MYFNLMIIGDEILHGNRADKHFALFKSLLAQYGLQLGQVQYLPDERALLVKQLQRSFSDGLPTFVTGGIGATPDDHTRQAAAEALALPLQLHPEGIANIEAVSHRRGDALDSAAHRQRLRMAEFPAGADLIPNSYNGIAGFAIREHYFLPGFPVMAHPMANGCSTRITPPAFTKHHAPSAPFGCLICRIAYRADYGSHRSALPRHTQLQPAQRRRPAR